MGRLAMIGASFDQSHERAARADAADYRIDTVPGNLLQNLGGGAVTVGLGVFRIEELPRLIRPEFGSEPFGFPNTAGNPGLLVTEAHGPTVGPNHHRPLVTDALRHHSDEAQAKLRAH